MSRGRRRLVRALIVLGSVLAFLSVFAIWIERQALNTDDWVATSGKLLHNEKIREAVGQLPGRPALRKRRRQERTGRHPSRRSQGTRRAGGRRAAPGRRPGRRKGAGNLDRAGTLGRREPGHPRTAAGGPGKQERSGRNRKRGSHPQPRQPAHQPRRAGRDRRKPGGKAAARRRPDHDPQVRPAEDGAEHRGRDQGPGAAALDPHLRRLRRGDLPLPRRALGHRPATAASA